MIYVSFKNASIGHQNYRYSPAYEPTKMRFRTDDVSDSIFFSEGYLHQVNEDEYKYRNRYGLIVESTAIMPELYNAVLQHCIPSYVNKFFTHNSQLIKTFDNCVWIPGGTVWIGSEFGGGKIEISKKSKLISMVNSNKTMCELHHKRNIIADYFTNTKDSRVSLFGPQYNGSQIKIADSLTDFMYSIVVENYIDDLYFTEKILNCFATGTIPIYIGARNIGEKFDTSAIIQTNPYDIMSDISICSPEHYYFCMEGIKNNFDACQSYFSIEDYIYERLVT